MPSSNITVSQVDIKVGGSPLDETTMNLLQEAVVEQNSHLPHMFVLRFRDPDMKLIDDAKFDTSKEVEITAEKADSGDQIPLIKGEITAIEPEFREGMILDLVIRGFDKSHRMVREVKSRSFLNKKDSQLAQEIASEHGLSPQVEATSTVYDHIYQHNQSDLTFLVHRAWRIGYECFVDDGKLYFRKPPASGTAISLEWGTDLVTFYPSLTVAEQVDEVVVRGWDMKAQKAIVGKASKGKLYPSINVKDGATQGKAFGTGKKTIVDLPVVSQAEADTLAAARLNEISGAFIQARGVALRRPDIKAGQHVELKNLGDRFSGKYLVTNARHIYEAGGLTCEFEVSGTRSGLLNEQLQHQAPLERWPGTVVAVVTDTNDPDALGRVKVKYPWMTEDADSFWARVISPGAGKEAGLFMVPEVEDEVMVVFEHGDFDRPYVLGGVWNGKNKLPPPGAGAAGNEKPKVRTWYSLTGHHISVYDNADNKIEIVTAGGHSLTMSDKDKKIELITSSGQKLLVDDQANNITMKTAGTVNLESTGAMTIKSTGAMKLESGATMDISANGPLNLKGAVVNIN
jgi:phage protein D